MWSQREAGTYGVFKIRELFVCLQNETVAGFGIMDSGLKTHDSGLTCYLFPTQK